MDKIYISSSEVEHKMRKMGKLGTVASLLTTIATIGTITYCAAFGPNKVVTERVRVQTSGDLVIEDKVRWDFYDKDDDGKIDLAYRTARGLETEFRGEDAQNVLKNLESRCAEYKKNPGLKVCF